MELGDNVTIVANSVVTKSFTYDNIMLARIPAIMKCNRQAWWENDEPFATTHQHYYELRIKMFGRE